MLARRQTAGRGSHGRAWSGLDGNLFLSILLRPGTPVAEAGHWSLLAGLAAIEALSCFSADPAALSLKWPNDVLQNGAKLAGILTESAVSDGRLEWIVIGIGANLAHAPTLPDRPTAALQGLDAPPKPEDVAGIVLQRLAYWPSLGWPAIRAAWLARAHPAGTKLAVTTGTTRLEGTFAGLSHRAELQIQTETGLRLLPAGDVSLA